MKEGDTSAAHRSHIRARMKDIRSAVERELVVRKGRFSNKHIAEALGISRQTAAIHLKRLVTSGELVRQGNGRGVKYSKGPCWDALDRRGVAVSPNIKSLWHEVARRCVSFVYVELRAFSATFRTAAQATNLLPHGFRQLSAPLIVFDFEGVVHIDRPFVRGLIEELDGRILRTTFINAVPTVRAVLDYVLATESARWAPHWFQNDEKNLASDRESEADRPVLPRKSAQDDEESYPF